MKDVKLAVIMFFVRSWRYLLLLLNKITFRIMSCMFIHKHLTYSLERTLDSFTTFKVAERLWKRHLKLCTQSKYKDYCQQQNEMSTKIHDAKKAREQNLSLSKQKNMKKKRQESVRNWVAKCRALKKGRVNNKASWQRQQQKQRQFWISHSHQLWKGRKL